MLDYLPEKELFKLIANGDEVAFATLFKSYAPKLHAFLFSRTHNDSNAEELVQQTFIRIWTNREKLGDIDNPNAWLYKVAANECYRMIRSQMVAEKAMTAVASKTTEVNDLETPGEQMQYKELEINLQAAINALPEQRKNVYILNRQHGMNTAEIAKALNISPKTAKNTLAASLKSIRAFLYSKYDYLFIVILLKSIK
ncbi:RNA polymerase sigma-70 factor [Chitinophagaceae bacterium 26-R-25]|nr:RNA polymerase sigma-70 factor [Chitinophagaceae bacterium 26-R-25]